MLDPRREVLLVRRDGRFVDKTAEVVDVFPQGGRTAVRFLKTAKVYDYHPANVRRLRKPSGGPVPEGAWVTIRGRLRDDVTEVRTFSDPEEGRGQGWTRVWFRDRSGERFELYREAEVAIGTPEQGRQLSAVLAYWRRVVDRLPPLPNGDPDPLRRPFAQLRAIHEAGALRRYLMRDPIETCPRQAPTIFPFRCNLSQRQAVDLGLTRSASVIEGPPGTGKTETILNLIANIVLDGHTVAVVSYGNSAVDNVREKLERLGFGVLVADLGRKEKREAFIGRQQERRRDVQRFVAAAPPPPPVGRLAQVDASLRRMQADERERAVLRDQLAAWELEYQHFSRRVDDAGLPDLSGFPLLRRDSDRVLDYLAETQVRMSDGAPGGSNRPGGAAGLVRRITDYLKYGRTRGLDANDTGVVLSLQRQFYAKRIDELRSRLTKLDSTLERKGLDQVAEDHRRLSVETLHAELADRYRRLGVKEYGPRTFGSPDDFAAFVRDHPVVLSTCHSIGDCVPGDFLFDYVIIDEASQVDLLTAALALSRGRRVVVVGDQQQLSHVAAADTAELNAPSPAFDYESQNVLSSLQALYGPDLPQTLLKEHYRCDPAIIGFCNARFYDGELIPYTSPGTDEFVMAVRPTVPGRHMRRHRGGGNSNQREIDVIKEEVIPQLCADIPPSEIGVTTPYRKQADKLGQAFFEQFDSDTVHKFQGRQKDVMILTTVLDDSWRGRYGLRFVDDPRLINVAVSRAARRFILVTHHGRLPASRYISDLIGYIAYQHPDQEVPESAVVSIFDLMYREYSARLAPLAARVRRETKYPSEDIAWTVIREILRKSDYAHLVAVRQVLLANILPGLDRLDDAERSFVRHRASLDFVIHNRVTRRPVLAIEVDGFAYHEDKPEQLRRDAMKNAILDRFGLELLRLPTTGSGEEQRIREALDRGMARPDTALAKMADRVIDLRDAVEVTETGG